MLPLFASRVQWSVSLFTKQTKSVFAYVGASAKSMIRRSDDFIRSSLTSIREKSGLKVLARPWPPSGRNNFIGCCVSSGKSFCRIIQPHPWDRAREIFEPFAGNRSFCFPLVACIALSNRRCFVPFPSFAILLRHRPSSRN